MKTIFHKVPSLATIKAFLDRVQKKIAFLQPLQNHLTRISRPCSSRRGSGRLDAGIRTFEAYPEDEKRSPTMPERGIFFGSAMSPEPFKKKAHKLNRIKKSAPESEQFRTARNDRWRWTALQQSNKRISAFERLQIPGNLLIKRGRTKDESTFDAFYDSNWNVFKRNIRCMIYAIR